VPIEGGDPLQLTEAANAEMAAELDAELDELAERRREREKNAQSEPDAAAV
jgi:hypothetical protein